jgi:hypothetical protein
MPSVDESAVLIAQSFSIPSYNDESPPGPAKGERLGVAMG